MKLRKIITIIIKLRKIPTFLQVINRVFLFFDILSKTSVPYSYPVRCTIALSNTCNYSCPICPIRKYENGTNIRVINNISLKQIAAFADLFKKTEKISFMGLVGESILNPEFGPIITYLKSEFNLWLSVSTNGFGLNEKKQDLMVNSGFDLVNFSLHAATPDTYVKMQGSKNNFKTVLSNLASINEKKLAYRTKKPRITIVYALNRDNIEEATGILDIAANNGVDKINMYHHRDYGHSELSLDNNMDYANKEIDKIYSYATEKGVLKLLPEQRPYYSEYKEEEELDFSEIRCDLPWMGLQMRSCYSHADSYYLGCCNVFNAFLFNYKEHIDHYGKLEFKKIWHHPVFQYLRKTVNSSGKTARNPLCSYCKSKRRDYFKNMDNKKNAENKYKVLDLFFEDYKKNVSKEYAPIAGLKILYTEDDELRSLA